MDSKCNGRGFHVKGMLAPLRVCKEVNPIPSNSSSSYSSSFSFTVHQDKVTSAKNHRVSLKPDAKIHEAAYFGVVVDEHIDRKASMYISSVQERFRLEGLISGKTSV